jgi:hypothetical protein
MMAKERKKERKRISLEEKLDILSVNTCSSMVKELEYQHQV